MAHFVGPDCTGRPSVAIHAGVNAVRAQYTLSETASASTTIAIASLPGGARMVGATLTLDNDALVTTGGGSVALEDAFGHVYIQTGSGSLLTHTYNPTDTANGVRLTSSSNLIVRLSDVVGTGTATTVFTVMFQYVAQDDPD